MTQDEIKELIRECRNPVGYIGNWGRVQWADNVYPQLGDDLYAGVDLEAFAKLVAAKEREASALIADSMDPLQDGEIGKAIRARGKA